MRAWPAVLVDELGERAAKMFTLQHHYASSWPAARLRYGLVDREDGALCGVLVLGVPMHPAVLTRPFPDLVPYAQTLELSRLILLDGVAGNGESWFTTTALRLAATDHGLRGAVAFADPVPRTRRTPSGPVLITAGHVGTVYQACSAIYNGLATPRVQTILPDAIVLTALAVQIGCAALAGTAAIHAAMFSLTRCRVGQVTGQRRQHRPDRRPTVASRSSPGRDGDLNRFVGL